MMTNSGVRRTLSGTTKTFKRGSGSLGQGSHPGGIRPGTAS